MKCFRSVVLMLFLAACSPISPTLAPVTRGPVTPTGIPPTLTPSPRVSPSPSTTPPGPTHTVTPTPLPVLPPTLETLPARVVAERLSCRYGPGPEYLYLDGLGKGEKLTLVGRTGGSHWVWVEGKNRCWVNANHLEIEGDMDSLPITYPEPASLPRSPYYLPTTVLKAVRNGDTVTVNWLDIPLRAGDEEDETMLHYIVETWRCEDGTLIFDPLATSDTSISFIDQPGCSQASHGRIFVQEKHGFAGPTEIPWP